MGLFDFLLGPVPKAPKRHGRKPTKAQAEAKRKAAIAKLDAKLRRDRERDEKRRAREQAKAEREREKRQKEEDRIARKLGKPTWFDYGPKRKRRNPVSVDKLPANDRRALSKAQQMSAQFHGTESEVLELDPDERRLPRYVVALGEMPEMSYEPDKTSDRAGWTWEHEAGDRGEGHPKARQRPMLAADPRTGRPLIVPMRSPVKFDPRKGLIG